MQQPSKMDLRKILKQEGGAALILALIILAIGSLLLVPLLSFVGSSFRTVDRVYDQKAYQLYAADAGVRDALVRIQNQENLPALNDTTSPFNVGTINGKNVSYTIEGIDPSVYTSAAAYRITSTASDPSDSNNKTVIQADCNFVDFFTTYTQNAITVSDNSTVNTGGGSGNNPLVYGTVQSSSSGSVDLVSAIDSSRVYTNSPKHSSYIDVENHTINQIFIKDGGSGYTSPVVSISGGVGSGATAAATVTGGAITSISVTNSGNGYYAPVVSISGGGGSGAYAVANVDSYGKINSYTVLNGGINYNPTPSDPIDVNISAEFGSGATATATVTNGTITSIEKVAPGSGYYGPAVNISGGGSGANAVATVTEIDPSPPYNFPSSGQILVDTGNSAETLDYVSISPVSANYSRINLAPGIITQFDHNQGAPVNLIIQSNDSPVWGWPTPDATHNPVQNYYYKQAMSPNVTQVSGGVIDLSATTIQGKPYSQGSLYINGDATITTNNHPVTLSPNSNGIIYVNGVLNFDNKCQLLLNGYTIFASSTLGSPLNHPNQYAMNFSTQTIIGGPGALIANGSIYFAPKITNSDEYLYVMSLMGNVQFQPQGNFSGSVAGYTGVTMQPGTSINWEPAPSGLNLPGQDQTLLLGNIKVWKIN